MLKKSLENDKLMKKEYDFTKMKGGVRGKYYKAYREDHTIKIHKMDGTTIVQHFTLEEGAVMLEPDVREYFPNSEAVNKALRCLIPLMMKKDKSRMEAKLKK
jgi:glutamine synthetase